jgi:hypothetical protein
MKKFLSFEDAKTFVHKLNLKNVKDWKDYCASGKRPSFIPASPFHKYEQYKGIKDWLGESYCERILGKSRKYNINDDFFKTWSHDMAYILGFWWADGSMSIKGNNYRFSLCQKDKYILESILDAMECHPKPIRPYNNCYIFSIASKSIVTDIMSLGGTPKKSLLTKFPPIPTQYLNDFIRGIFDGDGSIFFSTHNNGYLSKITCGCKEFISELHNVLKQNIIGLSGSINKVNPTIGKANIYSIQFGLKDTMMLGSYLYSTPSSLRLIRKYDLFNKSQKANVHYELYTYEQIKRLVSDNKMTELNDLYKYRETKKDFKIPSSINYYKKQYCGANKLFNKNNFLTYDEAKKYVSNLNIKGVAEWINWVKTVNRPNNIHTNPQKYYKNRGWISWYDFLGKKQKASDKTEAFC